jgi:hypothetical protein
MIEGIGTPYRISISAGRTHDAQVRKKLKFATFWHGDALSPYEWMCLKSFRAKHDDVFFVSYDDKVSVPEGIQVINANEVCDKALLDKFIYHGKPSLAGFTDYFRYRLIQKHEVCWFDADMMCLSPDESIFSDFIFGFEHELSINNAILKLPRNHGALLELIKTCEENIGKDLEWGALGPILLTRILTNAKLRERAQPKEKFYPFGVVNFWQLLLPIYRDKVINETQNSWSVHLWNELYKQIGNWKHICPPEGSFLHWKAKELDCLDRFIAIYPEPLIYNVVESWIANYERKIQMSEEIATLKQAIMDMKEGKAQSPDYSDFRSY